MDPAESDGLRPLFATYTVPIKPEPVSLGATVAITTPALSLSHWRYIYNEIEGNVAPRTGDLARKNQNLAQPQYRA